MLAVRIGLFDVAFKNDVVRNFQIGGKGDPSPEKSERGQRAERPLMEIHKAEILFHKCSKLTNNFCFFFPMMANFGERLRLADLKFPVFRVRFWISLHSASILLVKNCCKTSQHSPYENRIPD